MQAWQKLLIVAAFVTIIVIAGTLIYFNYFSKRRLFISTTTSLYDTGLLHLIETEYEATHNVDLNILAVGTGIAIQHAKNGDADIVLVHSPTVEKSFIEEGYGVNRKIIAYNFFTIIGPEDDPAKIEGKTVTEALNGIIEYGNGLADQSGQTQIWVSRGDNSGTHSKEKSLWSKAGYDYETITEKTWYASTGQGMGATLNVANEKNAYCLADIGTYLKFYSDGTVSLPALILEEQSLLNVYSVMAVNPTVPANQSVHEQINYNDAMEFIQYLVSAQVQKLITNFRKNTYGQSLFTGAVQSLIDDVPQPLVSWIKEYAFFYDSECPPQYRNDYADLYTYVKIVLADIFGEIIEAFQLIFTGSPEILGIVSRSLLFSGTAIILAILWGTPLALIIAMKDFRGKTLVKTFLNTLIGLPTVVLGLILFLIFSRGGPLGFLGLLYTPAAIIVGQAILVAPILVSIGVSAIESVDPEIVSLSKTLGASESQAQIAVLKEAASGIFLSDIASFNRAIGELGVVLLVGGNIAGVGNRTDVLTTAISRNVQIGELGLAVALGILLVLILFTINIIVVVLRKANYIVELAKAPYFKLKRHRETK